MQRWTTQLPGETSTQALGAALARALTPGLKIYLHGELGAGKTSLTRALVQAAGHTGRVKSPTYTLVEPYAISVQNQALQLMHFDLYRMGSPEEFIDAGFREYFDAITCAWWSGLNRLRACSRRPIWMFFSLSQMKAVR